jgi:hypothetical protein
MSVIRKAVIAGVSVFFLLYIINILVAHFYTSLIFDQGKETVTIASTFALLSSTKSYISEFYSINGRLPESNEELGIGDPLSLSERTIESVTIGPGGRIDASIKGVGENANIYLYATPNPNTNGPILDWHCFAKGISQSTLDTMYSHNCTLLATNEQAPGTLPAPPQQQPTVEAFVKAIHEKRNGLVRKLIKKNVDVNGRTETGESPLRAAIEYADSSVVQNIIRAGANVNEVLVDQKGITLLMFATENRIHADLKVRQLIEAGAHIEARDNTNKTPLIHAAINNDSQAVRVLLEHGAAISAVDYKGQTAADYAALLHGKSSRVYRRLSLSKQKAKEFIYRLPEE